MALPAWLNRLQPQAPVAEPAPTYAPEIQSNELPAQIPQYQYVEPTYDNIWQPRNESKVKQTAEIASKVYQDKFPEMWQGVGTDSQSIADWGRQKNEQTAPVKAGEEMDNLSGFEFTGLLDGLNADVSNIVEEGRVGRGKLTQDPTEGYYTDEYRAWLRDPEANSLPDGDIRVEGGKSTPELWGDIAYQGVGNFLEGIHGINTNLRQARSNAAEDGAEFVYNINGVGQYTNDDLQGITWEFQESADNEEPTYWQIGYQSSNGNFYSLDQLYDTSAISLYDNDTVQLGDGSHISWDEWESLLNSEITDVNITNEEAQELPETVSAIPYTALAVLPDGNKVTADQINNADYEQSNLGFANWNKLDPEIPINFAALFDGDDETGVFDNLGDFVPFTADILASSLPYMVPGYNALTASSTILPELEGYDSMTFDPNTGTYADVERNNAQSLGGVALGPGELISERLGGVIPGFKLKTGAKPLSGGKRFLKTIGEEALEELAMTPIETLQQQGFDDFAKNTDEFGNPIDTSAGERFRNFAIDGVQDATAGALLGGLLGGPVQLRDATLNRYNNTRLAPEIQPDIQGISSEQQSRLEELLRMQNGGN